MKLAFLDCLAYKRGVVMQIVTSFILSLAIVELWVVITEGNSASISMSLAQDTLKYMILASSLRMLIDATPWTEITERIVGGQIDRDILYPISMPVSLLGRSVGKVVFTFLSNLLPIFIILTFMYRITWQADPVMTALALLLFIIGYIIYFIMNMMVDMISFWWHETHYFHYIKESLFAVLSGALVPLWFFPQWLLKIVEWLPFRNILYVPIAVYLNTMTIQEAMFHVMVSAIWAVIFFLFAWLMWSMGVKKIVSHGG